MQSIDCHTDIKPIIDTAVKHIYLNHALTWFTPQNLGLTLLFEGTKLTVQSVVKIRRHLTQEERKDMLWQKSIGISSFMSPDVATATCLHNGTKEFWRACMNTNLSCERYVGRIKIALQKGKVKDSGDNVDKRLLGYLSLAYDLYH